MSGFCSRVDSEEEDFGATSTSGGDHSFAESELHLPRLQVSHDDHQAAFELCRGVGGFDTRENGSRCVATQANGQLDQLLGFRNLFRLDDSSHPKIDFGKVFDGACGSQRFG